MSIYDAGAATVGAAPRSSSGVGEVVMPGNIVDEIVTIDAGFRTLDTAIAKARTVGRVPAEFFGGWEIFRREWEAFRNAHRRWTDNLWYKSYQKALEYRGRLEEWRIKFEQLSGQKLAFPGPGKGGEPTEDGRGFPWRMLAYTAAGIGVLYGVSKLFSATAELKREVVPRRELEVAA